MAVETERQTLEPPVRRYLQELELAIKSKVGVVPEQAMSDAREFLHRDVETLLRSEPGLSDEEIYDRILNSFGDPESVARGYEDAAPRGMMQLPGYAPGWRIVCTKCGRSPPAAKAGITRIGARSLHKFTLGWCRDCRRLRFLRLQRDLHRTSLTDQVGVSTTEHQLLSKHRLAEYVLKMSILLLCMFWLVSGPLKQLLIPADDATAVDVFIKLPEGWTLSNSTVFDAGVRRQLSQKLGASIGYLSNNVLTDGRDSVQVNVLRGVDADASDKLYQALRKSKRNPRDVCRNGSTITEFVIRDRQQARLASIARYRLPVLPPVSNYRVRFRAAPVQRIDEMQRNPLFNHFLQWHASKDRVAIEQEITTIAKSTEFGDSLVLKSTGQGPQVTEWSFSPAPKTVTQAESKATNRYTFASLPPVATVPTLMVQGVVESRTDGSTPQKELPASKDLLRASRYWPADDEKIVALATKIVSNSVSDRDRMNALLAWIAAPDNMRTEGQTGSRYGTLRVLEQRFGHCWDYSDLFITLCRAAGIPARQIVGWLDGSEGHVWAEVLVDGRWHPVDPTTGQICGSDYIPISLSEQGEMTFVYASAVQIERL